MATLDEIRLQQLLSPFNRTGVMSSSQAVPMINNIPMINTGAIDQSLQNNDLIEQIIAENQMKANQFDPRNFQSIFPTSSIRQQVPLQNLGIDTSYGVANEPDEEQVEYLTEQEPSGIAKLFEFLGKLPTPFNLARRGLESLRGFNQRLQQSDFGQSKTLMEYLGKRQAKKEAERLAPIQKQLREASERGGGYQPTTKSQNVARTSSRVSDGKTRAYGL
jgi:hypothetical protein